MIATAAHSDTCLNTTAPGYFGFIPAGGLFAAAVADFTADVFNRYTGLKETAPALVQLEKKLLSWLGGSFGYDPSRPGGVFTSGGSLATFTAIVAARNMRLRRHNRNITKLVGHASAQAHHSVKDAFRLAGLPAKNLREIAPDQSGRMRLDDLRKRIWWDQLLGLEPFVVVATAGTTNMGAIDPLPMIASICEQRRLWLHVDAAYGGTFILCPEGKTLLEGISRPIRSLSTRTRASSCLMAPVVFCSRGPI